MTQPTLPVLENEPSKPVAAQADQYELIGDLARRLGVPLATIFKLLEGRVMLTKIVRGNVLFPSIEVERLLEQ